MERARPIRLYAASSRDVRKFVEGIFLGMLGCILLYTVFGFFLVRIHADLIASKMQLFLMNDMTPLIMPDDPYLKGLGHQLGSAFLFGVTLGPLTALLAAAGSVVPWITGTWGRRLDIFLAVTLIPACLYFMFSREMPVLSVVCGLLTPFFFLGPWVWLLKRSKPARRSPLRCMLFASLFLLPLPLLEGISALDLRDAMMDLPITSRVNDFYYNHTLLAAHVIKPVSVHSQKVVALSEGIEITGNLPNGSLWIRSRDPCSIRGTSMVASRRPLDCPCAIVSDTGRYSHGSDLLSEGRNRCDYNKAVRRGIRISLRVSFVLLSLLVAVWIAVFLEDVFQRQKAGAVLLAMSLFLLTTPVLYKKHLVRGLSRHPEKVAEKVHEYASSRSRMKRSISMVEFPGHLTSHDLESLAGDPNPKIRHYALVEIGERRDEGLLSALVRGLDDPELIVRTKACWALGEIGGEEALRMLDKAVSGDPSWYVRDYAYRARGRTEPVTKMVEEP